MAIWQFDLDLLPAPWCWEPIKAETCDRWRNHRPFQLVQERISQDFQRLESWSETCFRWGLEHGLLLEAFTEGQALKSLRVRMDLRHCGPETLPALLDLARDLGCDFRVYENGRHIPSDRETLVKEILTSRAMRAAQEDEPT